MKIEIRPAGAGDEDAFIALVDALADYEKLPRPTADARARLIRDGFGDGPRYTLHLTELDGEVVAYTITFFTYSSFLAQPTLYLEDVFVLPAARRHGVGGAIFRFLAERAVEHDCGRIEWAVLDWNRLAIDFYEKIGARRMSEWYSYRLDRPAIERLAGEP